MCQNTDEDPKTIRINFDHIPISALQHPTKCFLSQSLNHKKILLAENNCQRDWRGFAHLAGLNVSGILVTEADPMFKVLTLWTDYQKASFQDLIELLGQIDRWDVADDVIESLTDDARAYLCKTSKYDYHEFNAQKLEDSEENLQTASFSFAIKESAYADLKAVHQDTTSHIPENHAREKNVLITRSDIDRAERNLPFQRYDAFVIFADADLHYAEELVCRMEDEYNFVLCIKDRDILGGLSFEHDAVISLLRERCNRLIVIVSHAFLVSSLNNFFVQYAAALQIEKGCRKIIPCLYENCSLPNVLNCFSCLKYQQTGILYNFWNRLSDSIRSGRLEYSKTSNALVESTFVSSGKDANVNKTSEPDTEEQVIPSPKNCLTLNSENLNVATSEVDLSQTPKTKSKKWYKRIRRRLIGTFT